MFRSKLAAPIALAAVALALTIAACGGGDGGVAPSESLAAGAIGCEQMREDSYQYSVQVDQDVGPLPTVAPTPTGQGRPAFHFTTIVKGQVQDGVKLQSTVDNTDGHNKTVYEAIQIGDTGYLKFEDGGWQDHDTSTQRIPFPYWPMANCAALAADLDLSTLGAPVSEELKGVKTLRYELTGLGTDFFKHSPDFGSASDASTYFTSLSGTLWVAETGRYPVKFDVTGQGVYPSGQVLSVQFQHEVWDLGSDIKINEPPLGSPAS